MSRDLSLGCFGGGKKVEKSQPVLGSWPPEKSKKVPRRTFSEDLDPQRGVETLAPNIFRDIEVPKRPKRLAG